MLERRTGDDGIGHAGCERQGAAGVDDEIDAFCRHDIETDVVDAGRAVVAQGAVDVLAAQFHDRADSVGPVEFEEQAAVFVGGVVHGVGWPLECGSRGWFSVDSGAECPPPDLNWHVLSNRGSNSAASTSFLLVFNHRNSC